MNKQLLAFATLLFLIISPVASVSAQKRILRAAPLSEISDSSTSILAPETRISTEKTVYAAGENVVLGGVGFGKFEQVTINVERVNPFQKVNDLITAWTIAADENGNISAEWVMPFEGDFLIKTTGNESGAQTQTAITASVTPVVIPGNPSCATLNASNDPAFAHITSNFGFKLQNPSTGNYPFTPGPGREMTGGMPSDANNTLSITRLSETTIDWSSTRSIGAVIIKSGPQANVYPYNPAALSDQGLVTPTGINAISHVEVCPGPPVASITIIKDAQPNSPQAFDFTASGQINQNFPLTDNGVVGPDRIQFTNLTGFGAGNSVTVTEGASTPFSLVQINCTSNGSGVENNTVNVPARFATIQLEPGENVVCTFINAITTAANVGAGGRVADAFGNPISRARVTLQNASTGEIRTVSTGSLGYYLFENLPSGDFYIVTVSHGRYAFSQGSQMIVLNDIVENLDFTADLQ